MKGFNKVDNASMIIIKKIIGAHVKIISNSKPNFEKLNIELIEEKKKFKIYLNLNSSKNLNESCEEDNIFICIDSAFKKLKV